MQIDHLHHILEIYKHGSISKAAKTLYISQPSLSKTLTKLEEELGVSLFKRNHSGVEVTKEGEDVLGIIERALATLDELRYYGCEKKDYTGDVRILHTPAYGFMTYDLIQAVKNQYPKVNVILLERSPNRIVEEIQDGVAMIGLLTWGLFADENEGVLEAAGLRYTKMNTRRLKAYVSAQHPLAKQEAVHREELLEEHFISYSSSYWESIEDHLDMHRDALIVKDTEDIKKGVYRGQQIALLPDLFAIEDIFCQQGLIKVLPAKGEALLQGYDTIVYPKNKALSCLEKEMIDLMRRILCEKK